MRAYFRSIRLLMLMAFSGILAGAAPSPQDPAPVKEPGAAMILSTGDNMFYYKWFPIDSPAGAGASFDIFKSSYNVDRIIWRGAQAQWMIDAGVFQKEPEELADIYDMEMDTETKDHLTINCAAEAKKRGLSFWGFMPFFEVGAGKETVAMAGFGPYAFEERFRREHPEFCLWDRAGIQTGSTIEWGYPEVRKEWLDRYEKLFQSGGAFSVYDGIIFYSYIENFYPRYTDQYIYSDLAVKEFKKRYGVDVLTQPFDMVKFQEMRGEYITQYLREMRALFNKYGKKIAFYIDAKEPDIAQRWPCYPGILAPGSVKMDWQAWIKEGLIDEISLRTVTDAKEIQRFLDAAKGTSVRISVLTSQMPPEWKHFYREGVSRHIWSPEMASDFPSENAPVSALDGTDRIAIMSVLRQVRDGELDVPVTRLTALFNHPDLIVRRQAVAAVLGRRMTEAIPALEAAALDSENPFRTVVIDALGTLYGPNSVKVIGAALAKYPIGGMRIVCRTALSAMFADRSDDIIKLYQETDSNYVRRVIMEMPIAKRAVPPVDAIPVFRPLVVAGLKDSDDKLRITAAFTAAYYPDVQMTQTVLALLDDKNEVVQDAAAFSLGELARRVEDRTVREQIFQRLVKQQKLFGEGSKRDDLPWAYRVVGESLIYGFGPRGLQEIASILRGVDPKLAQQAWRILFHPNDGWNFYEVDSKTGELLYAYYPGATRMNVPKQTYSLPSQFELLTQTFGNIAVDPTGQIGSPWESGGKWTGLDQNVRFTENSSNTQLEIGVSATGKGARVVGTRAFDLPDGRYKNRMRGHFPSSPVAYGLADGVVDFSLTIHKSSRSDALQISFAPDGKSKELVGFTIGKDGIIQLQSNSARTVDAKLSLSKDSAQRFTLRLNFNTGKATLLTGNGESSPEFAFDTNRPYRAMVLCAIGDPQTSTQVSDLRLTQRFE